MITVTPFRAAELGEIVPQPAQASFGGERARIASIGEAAGRCFTIRSHGVIVMCGGAIELHADYARLWAVLSADSGPAMAAITRRTRWFIAKLPHGRIDASARRDFPQAGRWLRLLGFVKEAELVGSLPGGFDEAIYRYRRQ